MKKKLFNVPLYKYFIGYGILIFSACNYALSSYFAYLRPELVFEPKISLIDDRIPFIPVMVIFYILSAVFWVAGEFIIIRQDDRYFRKASVLFSINTIITLAFLYLMPTCINRAGNGSLAYAENSGFINWLLRMIYLHDGGTTGYSLFPSFHCSTSLCCYLGVKDNPEIPREYKIAAIIFTALTCISTVTIKQHYAADVAGGLLIPIIAYLFIRKNRPVQSVANIN